MPERSLKNYKLYLERLMLFATAMGIKVTYSDSDDEGIWFPTLSKIKLDENQSHSSEIASFLHELGHSMDDILKISVTKENALYEAYECIYADNYTKNQLKLVMKCERRAWANGRLIAKRLKIKLGKWYDQAEKACLKSYSG